MFTHFCTIRTNDKIQCVLMLSIPPFGKAATTSMFCLISFDKRTPATKLLFSGSGAAGAKPTFVQNLRSGAKSAECEVMFIEFVLHANPISFRIKTIKTDSRQYIFKAF